jgi:hypothetical protein
LDSSINNGEISILGFNIVRRDRNRSGGGVAMFIHDTIAFNPRPDLAVDSLEVTWVELLLLKTRGILVCSCYRSPADHGFLPKLEESLARINPGSEFDVLGDLNINIDTGRNLKASSILSNYLDLFNFLGCSQLITEPTRGTPWAVREGVSTDFLKFHAGPPCPTLIRPVV